MTQKTHYTLAVESFENLYKLFRKQLSPEDREKFSYYLMILKSQSGYNVPEQKVTGKN